MAARLSKRLAKTKNKDGLKFYEEWSMDKAIGSFKKAVAANPDNPEYILNLARAYARSGDFGASMKALGEYLRVETESDIAARYEWMFSTAMDPVEEILVKVMPKLGLPIPQVGKAIQMWLEYRITIGRRPLRVPKPELWAAAIAYAIIKVNFVDKKLAQVSKEFQVKGDAVKKKYDEVVKTLDLMPADYRYYTGDANPLDELVETSQLGDAAELLKDIDRRFLED